MISHITVHFYCKRAANGVPRVTFSQCRPSCRQSPRANRCLQGQPGTFGGSCRRIRRTLGGWAALSRLGIALKLAPAQVTKAGQVPFFHVHNVNDFLRAGAGGLWSFSFTRSSRTIVSGFSQKKIIYCSMAGFMVYTTRCIHSKLNRAAPDSDMSSSSRISTSA